MTLTSCQPVALARPAEAYDEAAASQFDQLVLGDQTLKRHQTISDQPSCRSGPGPAQTRPDPAAGVLTWTEVTTTGSASGSVSASACQIELFDQPSTVSAAISLRTPFHG